MRRMPSGGSRARGLGRAGFCRRSADGYEYGAVVFGCSDEKILNTFEIGLIESFQSRALELLEKNKSVLEIIN